MNTITLRAKLVGEAAFLPPNGFNFTSLLSKGEALSGTPVVEITLYSGIDSNPDAMKSGSPVLTAADGTVKQLFTAGTAGNIYAVKVSCPTTLGQLLTLYGYLAVIDVQAETFNIITEAGDTLDTEAGTPIRLETP